MLVAPIQNSKMSDATLLQDSVVVSDFDLSYVVVPSPSSYEPGTMLNYQSPEARFEGRIGLEADIWALGQCMIFETRAGFALFDSFLGSDVDILRQIVETLGRLPSNSELYGLRRTGSQRTSRIKKTPVCFYKRTEALSGRSYLR